MSSSAAVWLVCTVPFAALAAPVNAVPAAPATPPPVSAAPANATAVKVPAKPSARAIAARYGSRFEAAAMHAAIAAVHEQSSAIAMATLSHEPIQPQSGTRLADTARSRDLASFAAHTGRTAIVPDTLKAQVLAALSGTERSTGPDAASAHGAYAAGSSSGSPTPVAPQGSDSTIVTAPAAGDATILSPDPLGRLAGMAAGISAGGGLISLPDQAALSHSTALAIVKAFQAPPGTAEQAAIDAADAAPATNPALDERIGLARTVFKVDGTDQIIRHFVETGIMRAVVTEVAKYIEINKLSDGDKYRLATIVGAAQTELEDKILNLGAGIEANWLTAADLKLLVVAYDNDAQRKLTQMRLHDTGESDRRSMNDLQLARDLIIRDYDAK